MSDGVDFPTLPQVLAGEKRWCFIIGDNRETIKQVPDNSVQLICTSPPYYKLRDYQTGQWEGGDNPECDHLEPGTDRGEREELPNPPAGWAKRAQGKPYAGTCGKCGATRVDKQIGLEETPDQFCAALVELLRECRRVLHATGTVWLNLGDSMQAKQLLMMPARLAIALQNDGWYLRSFIPWIKRNPMPESVDDRPGSTLEYIMLLAKSPDYYYDAVAVRVPGAEPERERNESIGGKNGAAVRHGEQGIIAGTLPTRGRRNADWFFESWQGLYEENGEPLAMVVNIEGFKGSHFATFPTRLVLPIIQAGTSERGCCSAMVKKLRLKPNLTAEQQERVTEFLRNAQ